jgi:hypothetical protein
MLADVGAARRPEAAGNGKKRYEVAGLEHAGGRRGGRRRRT